MARKTAPHVTVLVTTYSGEQHLGEMIESILQQDYENWALIISDDGSGNTHSAVIDGYAAEYSNKIFVYDSGHRFNSRTEHLIHLLEIVRDDYIMFCGQEDIWHTDKISMMLHEMLRAEEGEKAPVLVHTDFRVMNGEGRVISDSFFEYADVEYDETSLAKLITRNIVSDGAFMVNRRLIKAALRYRDINSIVNLQWWMALCAAALGTLAVVDIATMDRFIRDDGGLGGNERYTIKYIVTSVLDGDIRGRIKAAIKQGAMLEDCFEEYLEDEDEAVCRACKMIGMMTKPVRIRMYRKYGLMPYGLLRKLRMIIWG